MKLQSSLTALFLLLGFTAVLAQSRAERKYMEEWGASTETESTMEDSQLQTAPAPVPQQPAPAESAVDSKALEPEVRIQSNDAAERASKQAELPKQPVNASIPSLQPMPEVQAQADAPEDAGSNDSFYESTSSTDGNFEEYSYHRESTSHSESFYHHKSAGNSPRHANQVPQQQAPIQRPGRDAFERPAVPAHRDLHSEHRQHMTEARQRMAEARMRMSRMRASMWGW